MSDSPNRMTRKTDVAAMMRQLAAPAPAKQETTALPQYEIELALHRHHKAFEDEREAQRQAEEAAANTRQNPADALRAALGGGASGTVALNSADMLRAALGGSHGTINGQPR